MKKLKLLLTVSILLNLFLIGTGMLYAHQLSPGKEGYREIAQKLGIVEERRPAYNFYGEERFSGLPGAEITVIGDSQAERGPWSEVLGKPVANRGQSGKTISEVQAGLSNDLDSDTSELIIWAGTNDAIAGRTPEQIQQAMESLISEARRIAPQAKVYTLGVPLVPADKAYLDEVNQALAVASQQKEATFIPTEATLSGYLVNDGVHVKGQGYVLLGQQIKQEMG